MTRLPTNAGELRDMLTPLQEKRGYFFNADQAMTEFLLEQLLVTKERYGYMACPCRLANGEYGRDRDIICPCAYRADDVAEYGSCYCGLYVSREWNEQKREFRGIPDRRPPENIVF